MSDLLLTSTSMTGCTMAGQTATGRTSLDLASCADGKIYTQTLKAKYATTNTTVPLIGTRGSRCLSVDVHLSGRGDAKSF